ncbi:hypothetical protein [Pseudomonas graminis]|uniref:Uncharacterized protein n=1 Tax=Pseudomonas graminis TaxID=158627 RepID=A0A1I0JHW4_9PSED|nr:hypothetical protein SAMN05216197_15623 [Pseudomonas graminis]
MATPLNLPVGGDKREPQVAIVPLDQIQVEDVGLGAANFDAWLQEISGGVVTLERIKTLAGGLPVVGNIMALVDALNDIVRLATSDERDPLDWVSLGINLIGMVPIPPGMAAARMSLRPMLFLVRQERRQAGNVVLGDALIEVLIGHLNATIVGTLDDFVSQAHGKLPGILEDAGSLGKACCLRSLLVLKCWSSRTSTPRLICVRRSSWFMPQAIFGPTTLRPRLAISSSRLQIFVLLRARVR